MPEQTKGSLPLTLIRLNALIDGGWLAFLKPTEANVYLIYNKFADNVTGECWPAQATVAKYLRTDVRNIQKARRALISHGLLQIIEAGGGYNKEGSRIKVCFAGQSPSPPVDSTDGENYPRLNSPPVNFALTPGKFCLAPPVNSTPLPPVDSTDQTHHGTHHGTHQRKTEKEFSDGFNRFWNAYPAGDRKTDKTPCFKMWKARNLESKTEEIIAGLEKWKLSRSWSDGFMPLTATFLNKQRWEEAPEPKKGVANVSRNGKPAHAGTDEELCFSRLPASTTP